MRSGQLALVAVSIASVSASCSQEPRQWRLELGSSTDSVDDNGARKIEMQAGETTNLELVVIGSPSNSIAFEADGLPPFATLNGPILKLAPGRPDAGNYTFSLTAKAGHDSSTAKVELVVHRFNSAAWAIKQGISDDDGYRIGGCPGPYCTFHGTGVLLLSANDDECDGMTAEAEVVPRGQPFTGVPTHSLSVAARSAGARGCDKYAELDLPLTGLVAGQSYDLALRIKDEFGAFKTSPYTHEGWDYYRPAFDQGPCVDRQCACLPSGPRPLDDPGGVDCSYPEACCSGVCVPGNGFSPPRCQ